MVETTLALDSVAGVMDWYSKEGKAMFGCANITINANGIPYLRTNQVQVTTETVDFALGFRRIPPVGLLAVNIANAIPEGTEGTLPVRLTLNGQTRAVTYFGGEALTAADVVGTGVLVFMYDWYNGLLQVISVIPEAAAAATSSEGE